MYFKSPTSSPMRFWHFKCVKYANTILTVYYLILKFLVCRCHLPVLYIGLEYGLTNNPKLAERFFNQALTIAPEDPFVLHEMGVIAFQNQE
jgi:anaphase-promoting complex subunit 6